MLTRNGRMRRYSRLNIEKQLHVGEKVKKKKKIPREQSNVG